MQYKSLLALTAIAMTASAQTSRDPAVGGAMKGLITDVKREKPHVAPPAAAGAMKGLSAGMKRAAPAAADDGPWIPEWSPGQSIIQEAPENPPATQSPPAQSPPAQSPPAQSPPAPSAGAPAPAATTVHRGHEQATGPAAGATSKSSSAPPAAGTPPPAPTSPATSRASAAGVSVGASIPGASVPGAPAPTTKAPAGAQTTPAPSGSAAAPAISGQGTKGPLTFEIINKMGGSISISYQLGTYSTAGQAPTVAKSLVGPSNTVGTFATSTQVVAPVGWAGRMTIGKAGAALDYRGTKIEGNNGFDGADPNADPDPDVDVSYVDGYSIPATCSCGNVAITGCNKELFSLGNKCDNLVGDSDHKICVNDPRNAHGPANAFFAPCKASAYTYDYDDTANWQGSCPGNKITCCIGTDCTAPTRQPAGNSKREVMALIGAKKRSASQIES